MLLMCDYRIPLSTIALLPPPLYPLCSLEDCDVSEIPEVPRRVFLGGQVRGDMGRFEEVWGGVGRCGEVWGGATSCSVGPATALSTSLFGCNPPPPYSRFRMTIT